MKAKSPPPAAGAEIGKGVGAPSQKESFARIALGTTMTRSIDLDFRNVNSLWASVLVETLVQLGLRHVVISPGSRSAPLAFAFARHPRVEAIPVLDERSAAFFALGLAKSGRRPVALVCTSGTAGANYLPAVIEAHESETPLLVFTADRPPEMRDCHSGQTVDQQKLFGRFVRFHHEFAVPEPTLPLLRYLRQMIVHAYSRSLLPAAGAVHLNCPFRDPLPPVEQKLPPELTPAVFREFFAGLEDYQPQHGVIRVGMGPVWPRLTQVERGVIVVGPCNPDPPHPFAQTVGRLSNALGWPVLADALAPVRMYAGETGHVVAHYDAILRNEKLAAELRPEQVICLGDWPTSKVLRTWLQQADPITIMVGAGEENRDALHLRTGFARATLGEWASGFRGKRPLADYAKCWLARDRRVATRLGAALSRTKGLVEPACVPVLAKNVPAHTPVFAASSMPVRDLEYFWPKGRGHQRFLFNRGANGIDGTLSTALGAAHDSHHPAVLLTGDLALLHDTNGFLSVPQFKGSLTIVLINNHGGGIFEHLPVARFEPPFEKFFATPQRASFKGLCAAYGVKHVRVRDQKHLAALVRKLPARGVRVLEVVTDRKHDAALRKELLAGVAAGL